MLSLLDEKGWLHTEKAQLLTFMEGVIHLSEDESSREYEEWEAALAGELEARKMYVSIVERKGIEKGRSEGIQLGRSETARSLLAMNVLNTEQIAQATGLSIKEIEALNQPNC